MSRKQKGSVRAGTRPEPVFSPNLMDQKMNDPMRNTASAAIEDIFNKVGELEDYLCTLRDLMTMVPIIVAESGMDHQSSRLLDRIVFIAERDIDRTIEIHDFLHSAVCNLRNKGGA